jgi:acylphosphatase
MAVMKRVHIFVSGIVQGVCYRAETWNHARMLGLAGWVRNLRDGRVEAVFEGEPGNVDSIIEWCRQGPAFAEVTDLTFHEEPYVGNFEEFTIRY